MSASEQFTGTDRFKVLRRLGAGGMGVVYETMDCEREQRLALKTLLEVDAQAIYRFKREFRSLAEIAHPNLISLYELFAEGDQWFFTMELIEDGKDFLSYIGRTELSRSLESSVLRELEESSLKSAKTLNLADSGPETETRIQTSSPNEVEETRRFEGVERTGEEVERTDPELTPLDHEQLGRLREVMPQLVEGVAAIHRAGKLHRDLKPGNVMVRPDGRVVILDFGLAVEARFEFEGREPRARGSQLSGTSARTTDGFIVGTAAYMSPEQAGGKPLTEASDWYSVGVMLFAALTGRLPLRGTFWRMLQKKQEQEAPAPGDLVAGIPDDLNSLCIDLLRRDAGSRPGAAEIIERLNAGAGHAASTGSEIDSAIIEDLPFVGREQQRLALFDGFEKMLDGRTVILQVTGRSGSGKTALIEHFLREISERRDTLILTGRCYEQETVPYKAIDTVIDALTIFLMRLPRREVAALMPAHIAALARIFPVLNRVEEIARQANAPGSATELNELRRQAFGALRELLARVGRRWSLIIYIDDLQWGDIDSANLLSELIRPPDSPRLMLLVSYRSEDTGSSAFLKALAALNGGGDSENKQVKVSVDPLSVEESQALALQLLGTETEDANEKASRIALESGGSPYFVYELVRHLRSGRELVEAQDLDLDRVLWMRVQRLPEDARRLLEVVAVSGQPTQLRYAQRAAGLPFIPPQMVTSLRVHHFVRSTGPGLGDNFETYHDRVRESILANLTAETLKRHHNNLAESLEAAGDIAPEALAGHFYGAERFEKAGFYFEAAAEQAVKALAFERADDFFRRAEDLATDLAGRARIQEKRIHFYTDLARFQDAYDLGYRAVQQFGVRIPRRFNPPAFAIDLALVRLYLGRRKIPDLIDLPALGDEKLVTAVRLIAATGKVAYQLKPELCIWLMARLVKICLRRGNTPDCAIGYVAFGSIFLGGVLGRHKVGNQFGRLALEIVEKYDNRKQRAEVNFLLGYFGTSWLRPAVEAEQIWQVAYQAGLESGDLFHTGCAACATVLSMFMRGAPLSEVWRESERYLEFLRRVNLREPAGAVMAVRQAIKNLRGETESRLSFSDAEFREEEFVERLSGFGSRHFAHYYFVVKMQALYLWGEYEKALEVAQLSANYLKDSQGMLHSAEHHFWHGLILARCSETQRGLKRIGSLRKLRGIHRKFRRWSQACPDNFLHQERLIAAEIFRLNRKIEAALEAYNSAAEAASRYGYLQLEALSNELSARLRQSKEKDGKAQDCYRRWRNRQD